MPRLRNTTILEPLWLSTPMKVRPEFADLVSTKAVRLAILLITVVVAGHLRLAPLMFAPGAAGH